MTVRNYSNTAAQSTLSASIAATDTSFALTGYAGDPTPPFTAALARGTANEEVVLVTAVVGSTVTVTRGYDGTTAKAQSAGTTFQEVVAAIDFREANAHVNSGASGAHGTTSQIVGVNDTQTLTNKTLTSPTITNPTITGTQTVATSNITTLNVSGVATLASASVTGNATVGGTLGVTGATTLVAAAITTLTVSGASTLTGAVALNGGATVPTGKKLTLTDAPASATDAANKGYVDAVGVSAPTVSTVVKRDSAGRAQVVDPAVAADIATKNYVDGRAPLFKGAATPNLRMWTATGNVVFSSISFVIFTIDYTSAGFTAPPVISAMAMDGGNWRVYFAGSSPTATSATLVALSDSNQTGTVPYNVIAIGV